MSPKWKETRREIVLLVLLPVIIALVLRATLVETRVVPTGSMQPTIQIGNRVLVNKYIYCFRDPERGDIVVFHPPTELASFDTYIKRVVGLPGETVEVRNHKVFINGKALKETYISDPADYTWGPFQVPSDCVMVLGDNRNNSTDTHLWHDIDGRQIWLKKDRIEGQAFMIYWPLDQARWFSQEVEFE